MTDLKIITHPGAMGHWDGDDVLDTMLRNIGAASQEDGDWGEKYGSNVGNDVFVMHRFCWCEREDCAWCALCTCDEGDKPRACDYCLASGVLGEHGTEPGMAAPNFWHKASGLKVWWYKYIGRSTKVVGPKPTLQLLSQIEQDCLASLKLSK